jgi:hypothetical protein
MAHQTPDIQLCASGSGASAVTVPISNHKNKGKPATTGA